MIEGAVSSTAIGLTQNYIVPFALQIQATTLQIGLLTSIPNIMMAFSQLIAPYLTEKIGSRKGIIMSALFLDTIMWLPIILIPYLFKENSFLYFLIFFTFKTIGGGMAGPPWGSMMSDLAVEGIRGRYFSRRNMLSNTCAILIGFVAMSVMQHYENVNDQFTGFSLLFGCAFTIRLIAVFLFTGMYDPPVQRNTQNGENILHTIKSLKDSNLGKFIMVMSLTMFTMNIAGPFFNVYLLRDLKLDYVPYIIIITAGGIFSVLFQPFWGRRADKFGNVIIIKIVTVIMPLVPISFIFSSNVYYLIGSQLISSFALSGFNLASGNFLFDAAEPNQRQNQLAIFNMFAGLAVCTGALLGGFLAPHLPFLFGYQLRTLFLIAGLVRLLVVTIGFRQIKEVRRVPKISVFNFLIGKFPKPAPADSAGKSAGFDLLPDFKDDELVDGKK